MRTLAGIEVKLERPLERDQPCCSNICTISAGKGPPRGRTSLCRVRASSRLDHESHPRVARRHHPRDGVPATPIAISLERLLAHKVETFQRTLEAQRAVQSER
jgi:hypothetical protein